MYSIALLTFDADHDLRGMTASPDLLQGMLESHDENSLSAKLKIKQEKRKKQTQRGLEETMLLEHLDDESEELRETTRTLHSSAANDMINGMYSCSNLYL